MTLLYLLAFIGIFCGCLAASAIIANYVTRILRNEKESEAREEWQVEDLERMYALDQEGEREFREER